MNRVLDEFNITEEQYKLLDQYFELLVETNKVFNLTRVTEYEEVYIKHYYDSMLLFKCLDSFDNLIDVGSGAGFPGIVIKIFYPDLNIVLVDSLNKRINFLNTVIKQLGLEKIQAIHARIEEYSKINQE